MLLMCLCESGEESEDFPKGGTANKCAIAEQKKKKELCIYKPKQKITNSVTDV